MALRYSNVCKNEKVKSCDHRAEWETFKDIQTTLWISQIH